MMPRLNQVIALVKSKKGRAASALAEQTARVQKPGLLDGITRHYQPKADDGERLPSEVKMVQAKALPAFDAAMSEVAEVLDLVLTQDKGNTLASADLEVDGIIVAADVPVSFLLFLEKKLKEVESFVSQLPTLDPGENWKYEPAVDCYASSTRTTTHTKKVPKNHVKAPATPQHPAQVETYVEDVVIGYWNTTKFSGAIPAQDKNQLLGRVRKLQDAVKLARESANGIDVRPQAIGAAILSFIRAPVSKEQ